MRTTIKEVAPKPKQIGLFISEVLTLGVTDDAGNVVLLTPTHKAKLGSKMY